MKDKYYYLDVQNIYTYPNSSVLKNRENITRADQLQLIEHLYVSNRVSELADTPIFVNSMNDVRKIHKYLFQDIYTWAGEYRKVNISKEGKPFISFKSKKF